MLLNNLKPKSSKSNLNINPFSKDEIEHEFSDKNKEFFIEKNNENNNKN